MELKHHFFHLFSFLNYSESETLNFYNQIDRAYSSKSRHYHNWNHIQDMMQSFFKYQNSIENPLEFQLSIFYHDIIYKVNKKDNEEQSAELAVKIFQSTIVKSEMLENLILSTKHHSAKTKDEKWLIDFDLAVLGRTWEEYQTYFQNIRKEYKIYPNLLYKPGRKKVLIHFLEKERIFLTDEFYTKYESIARQNLEKEIELL